MARLKFSILPRIALAVSALAPLALAQASTCFPLQMAYYAYCEKSVCRRGIAVGEIKSHLECGRRKEVRDLDPWALALLTEQLRAAQPGEGGKLVQLTASVRDWGQTALPASRAEYDDKLRGDFFWIGRQPRFLIQNGAASPADLEYLRKKEAKIAQAQWWENAMWLGLDWSALLGTLLVIVWTVRRYVRLVRTGLREGRRKYLLAQIWIFAIAAHALADGPHLLSLAPLTAFLFPAIWIYQTGLAIHFRRGALRLAT